MLRNLARRFPPVKIKLIPTLVQGIGAAADIVRSLRLANRIEGIDVIILGRGGGSLEDLWCFNEEIVARAIFSSKTPIISAVGHETDFTISDFAADARAATPSTAAELAVPDKNELLSNLANLNKRLLLKTRRTIDSKEQQIHYILDRPIFKRPFDLINQHLQQIDELMLRLAKAIQNCLRLKGNLIDVLNAKLQSLDPKAVLARGYSVAVNNGRIVRSINDAKVNDIVDIIVSDGKIISKVAEVKNGKCLF